MIVHRSRSMRRTGSAGRRASATVAVLVAALASTTALGAGSASAVNTAQPTLVSATPASFTPQVMNGAVIAITQVGNKIVAAGSFTTVRQTATSADITRNRMFAFDATTGQIDMSFNPNVGGSVNSLDTDGTYIYAGGSFGSVGGSSAIKRVVKLDASGAVVSAFKAVPNKAVNEVVVRGSRLYVGGAFTSIKAGTKSTRTALAALDATTGSVLPAVNVPFAGLYNGGSTSVKRFDVTRDGRKLVAIGNFTTVGGQPRQQIVMLDTPPTGNASVSSWSTNRYDRTHNPRCATVFDTFMRDVDFAPDGSYFAVTSTGAFGGGSSVGTLCDTTTRWETNSTGNDPTWADYTGGDTTYGVAVTGSAIYVGGHMRWENNPFQGDQAGPGAVPRQGIAALDPLNGLPLSWNPGRIRGTGAQALFATSTGLWVGSDTKKIAGQLHQRIAFMPLAGGRSIPVVAPASLPNTLFLAQRGGGAGTALLRRPVDSSGSPTGPATTANTAMDWSAVRGAFLVNSTLYYGLADGRLYSRTFTPSSGAVGPQRAVNLYDDPDSGQRIPFAIANLTGMFFDPSSNRIYYTLVNDSRLYYRYFTPESEVVGAQEFQAASGGVNFAQVSGMTLAGGRVLYGSSADGALRSLPFAGGAVTGSPTVVSNDGSWLTRGIFVPNG
jgi:hypothetical protein